MAERCMLLLRLLLWLLHAVMLRWHSKAAWQGQAGLLLRLAALQVRLLMLQETLVCERLLQLLCRQPTLQCT
jgi:hypothetical protein